MRCHGQFHRGHCDDYCGNSKLNRTVLSRNSDDDQMLDDHSIFLVAHQMWGNAVRKEQPENPQGRYTTSQFRQQSGCWGNRCNEPTEPNGWS